MSPGGAGVGRIDAGSRPSATDWWTLESLHEQARAMAKRLYVGNLAYSVTSEDLQEMFEQFGPVRSAQVLIDRETNRSRGFGFVEMDNDPDAEAAIEALDGNDSQGRRLTVNEAKPRTPGGGGGGRRRWLRRRRGRAERLWRRGELRRERRGRLWWRWGGIRRRRVLIRAEGEPGRTGTLAPREGRASPLVGSRTKGARRWPR